MLYNIFYFVYHKRNWIDIIQKNGRYNFWRENFLCLFLTAMTNRVNEWATAYYSVYFNDFSLSCKLHQPCIYTSILISTIFAYISLFNNNLLYIDNSTSSVMYSALDLHWVTKSFIIHPPTRDSIQLVFFCSLWKIYLYIVLICLKKYEWIIISFMYNIQVDL